MKLAWSNFAKQELREIYRFSVERWDEPTSSRYIEDIRDAANRVAAQPALARPLKGSFRIHRVRSHYLIVEIDAASDRLTVARILHVAMDLSRHLP